MEVENAKGPAGIGQYMSWLALIEGNGEGGRNDEQKYVLFTQASKVRVCVDVKSVAKSRA